MGFKGLKPIISSFEEGRNFTGYFRKVANAGTVGLTWMDLSMSPGNPAPNYYANTPLEASVINTQSIPSGPATGSLTKHLIQMWAMTTTATATPLQMILCDYLLYYPFVDQSAADEQLMDNTLSLTRYTDGAGVKIIPVMQGASSGVYSTFQVKYVNQDGVSNRISQVVQSNLITAVGNIPTTGNNLSGPFIPLQEGDTGVRSIQSVTYLTYDVGLLAFVLVKPIASLSLRDNSAPAEVNYLQNRISMPQIYDGAYLNFICHCNGNINGASIIGGIQTIWG